MCSLDGYLIRGVPFFLYMFGRLPNRESTIETAGASGFRWRPAKIPRNGVPLMRPVGAGLLAASRVVCSCLLAFSAPGPEPNRTAPLAQHDVVAGQQPCTWGVLTNS